MLTRKCDICGKEMRMATPRYKVTFDGWLYTEKKDICADCFKRIKEEIKQADTPQTESQRNSEKVKGTPQTESTGSPIGDYRDGVGAWQTERMTEEEIDTILAKALVGQTDCGWGKPTTVGSDEDKEV